MTLDELISLLDHPPSDYWGASPFASSAVNVFGLHGNRYQIITVPTEQRDALVAEVDAFLKATWKLIH